MPLDNVPLPPLLERRKSEQSAAAPSQLSLGSVAGSAAGSAADSFQHLYQMMNNTMENVGSIRRNSMVSSAVPPDETFLDTARGGLANLAARIRARTGQALTFDTESELFHDWSGVKVIRHQTAAEKYPEQIQELLERAHNKLADRNEYAEKIANKQRVVERLMFMVQQSRHDIKHNKQSLQEVDRSMEKDKAKAAELEAKYNISFDMIEAKKYRPYKASRRSCLVAILWDVDHLHCSSSHYRA